MLIKSKINPKVNSWRSYHRWWIRNHPYYISVPAIISVTEWRKLWRNPELQKGILHANKDK